MNRAFHKCCGGSTIHSWMRLSCRAEREFRDGILSRRLRVKTVWTFDGWCWFVRWYNCMRLSLRSWVNKQFVIVCGTIAIVWYFKHCHYDFHIINCMRKLFHRRSQSYKHTTTDIIVFRIQIKLVALKPTIKKAFTIPSLCQRNVEYIRKKLWIIHSNIIYCYRSTWNIFELTFLTFLFKSIMLFLCVCRHVYWF